MTHTLLSIFPDPNDLLSLEAEELGCVLLDVAPGVVQNGMFGIGALVATLFSTIGPGYSPGVQRPVTVL
jgi:hypothetical protein